MGKGAGESLRGPFELQQQAHPSHSAGVSGSTGPQTCRGGPSVRLEAKVCAANSVCESCSWGASGQRNDSLENAQSPTVLKKSLTRQIRCHGT